MRLLLGGAYFWEGAYYRSLISSLQQMRLLLSGAYYWGALIIGRYNFQNRAVLINVNELCWLSSSFYERISSSGGF